MQFWRFARDVAPSPAGREHPAQENLYDPSERVPI
jgi:hypothetical protein